MLKTKEEIKAWLNSYNIKNYTINDDLTVDVDDNVDLNATGSPDDQRLDKLPIQFGEVEGNFDCSYNKLTSCAGFPIKLCGNLICNDNEITSLIGCPRSSRYFTCSNNKLTSLVGGPEEVYGWYNCSKNELTSLIGSPSEVGQGFDCGYNKLESLENAPKYVGGSVIAPFNPIKSLANFKCNFQKEFRHVGSLIPYYESFYNENKTSGMLFLNMKHDELMKVTETIELMKKLSELKVSEKTTKKPKI